MVLCHNGIAYIERNQYTTSTVAIAKFDKKYGKGKWKYTEPICSCLEPGCGYGAPLENCPFKNGICCRPVGNFDPAMD